MFDDNLEGEEGLGGQDFYATSENRLLTNVGSEGMTLSCMTHSDLMPTQPMHLPI